MSEKTVPYWRLSSFYFFYFASLGVLVPYWGLYLKSLGYDAVAIGSIIAIIPATKIFAPYVWGWICDHTGRPVHIIRITNFLAIVAFAGVFINDDFIWLSIVMFGFSAFWNSSLPLIESTTLNHLGENHHDYSAIRLWGSLGFILTVVILGEVLEYNAISLVPKVILAFLVGIFLMSLLIKECAQPVCENQSPIYDVIKQPAVLAFLGVCFLMLLSHGPYYTFYSIYLEDNGYSRHIIGVLWAVGVIAEVIVFVFMSRLLTVLGVRNLLLMTFIFTAIRWVLIGYFIDNLAVLFFAQLFHAFSFGVFHAVGIALIHYYFKGKHQNRGQALYTSLSFGVGGALGSFLSGIFWDKISHTTLFMMAAGVSLLATVIIWKYIHTDITRLTTD